MTPRLGPGCVIAVLGAESSGKTVLAAALAERLAARGVPAQCVPEVLREWCRREQRTPRADEQAAIADEQTRRIAAAAATGVAVADTTALMTAVYSDLLFGDRSLYDRALAAQRGYAIALLMALDLPWVADGLQRDGPHVRAPVDAAVRAALARGGVPFAIVHGSGPQRLASAWNAINSIAAAAESAGADGQFDAQNQRWRWPCEKCSDPACEHRLFSGLLDGKA